LQQYQANSDISELLLQIRTTRQYAITYSQYAVLCPSHNKRNCVNDWKAEKMIFLDTNNNNIRDANEVIERQFNALLDNNIVVKYPKTQIRFNDQGIANFFNGTLAYCSGGIIHGLVISRLGRIRMAQDLDGDHNPDVNNNTAANCD
jgi:type IV fimbrial biogenesis protein FimT